MIYSHDNWYEKKEQVIASLASAMFNDLGTLDSHTATIDWGDGTAVETGTVSESPFGPPGSALGADGTVGSSHVYEDDGIYTVTVTVTDDDGASASDTLTITVYADSDRDGTIDTEEYGPTGDNEDYDGNGDGTADSEQANVTSFHTVTDDYVTLATPEGTTLIASCIENPSPGDFPAGVEAPCGFFEFTITGVATGGATTVTLILPDSVSSYYQYGPTPDNTSNHWYEFMYDGETGAQINGNVVTLYFVDGLRGDHDIAANGTIVDPGGPAIPPVPNADITLPPVAGLNDVLFRARSAPGTIFAASRFTIGSRPYIVLKSVYDSSPITPAGFWPESFALPETATRLLNYATILQDNDGTRLDNMRALLDQFDGPLSEELMTLIASELTKDGTNYAAAGEWLDALVAYIDTLEVDVTDRKAVASMMRKYGPQLEEDDERIEMFIEMYLLRF